MGNKRHLSRFTKTALVVLPTALLPMVQVAAQTQAERQMQLTFLFGILAIAFVVGAIILFIPAIIAFRRDHPNKWAIAVVCLAFGGTVIGWFGALIWALHAVHKSPDGNTGGESGLNLFGNDPVRVKVDPDITTTPEPNIDALAERLSGLKKLFDDGLISDEEHRALRKSALDAL